MKLTGIAAAVALASSLTVASAATEKTTDYNFDVTITKASKITGDVYCSVQVSVSSTPFYYESATSKAKGSKCLVKLPVRWVEKDLPTTLNFSIEVYAREKSEPYIELRSHRSSISVNVPAGNKKTVKSTYKLRF